MPKPTKNAPPDGDDEDWLDLQENLQRSPRETRRTDLLFVLATLLLCALLALGIILVAVVVL